MSIKPPDNRSELEHNLHLMEEKAHRILNSGNEDAINNFVWATWPHLKKVNKLPNRRIQLATINEMIRLQANMENSELLK